jgi:bifunctional non-homologous end joining protein LigD
VPGRPSAHEDVARLEQHGQVHPMLATPADPVRGLPSDGAVWAFEVKWDGVRVLADLHGGAVRLTSRRGNEVTAAYPEFASLGEAHPDALLDAEVVVLRGGVPSFEALAERMHVRDARRARALAAVAPATLIVFDVLRLYDVDLTGRPWSERREVLERLSASGRAWQLSPVYDDGAALLAATREQNLEGVVAKRRSSRYHPGVRSSDWVKFAHRRTRTCLVAGWRPETGDARRVGALLLGLPDGAGGLAFAGRVGSGLAAAAAQDQLTPLLAARARADTPFTTPVPREDARGTTWVEPTLLVEVRYLGHTEGGRLRQPVFLGVRTDLEPADLAPLPAPGEDGPRGG